MRQDLATLRDYAASDRAALRADPVRLDHVRYLFVTLLEGCIDAAQHVRASEGWGPPDTNADAMLVLARNDLLSEELSCGGARRQWGLPIHNRRCARCTRGRLALP